MDTLMNTLTTLRRDDGQSLVEYALIISLIALVAVGGLALVGNPNPGFFSQVADLIK